MRVYRGCIMLFFTLVLGIFALLMGRALGLLGYLFPFALFGFSYLVVQTVIVELYYWNRDR